MAEQVTIAVAVVVVAVVLLLIGAAIRAVRGAVKSARLGPTPNEAKANAKTQAVEVLHAPDSIVAARVDELRKRGRSGK